ncbi:hypothetical protein Scep_018109 [Stephania cephalantha]|uniref:4-coumarate--CoA ligase n=1 Tax=Stephania cephalantha TaxID=152367 RepID=A0AAP0ISV2_9MAGN
MAKPNQPSSSIDQKSGFCSATKIFHSLKPPILLPPEHQTLSVTDFAFSLSRTSPSPETAALIDSATANRLSYRDLGRRTETLASSLQSRLGLSRGDTAFVIAPSSVQLPILYLSLISIGVVISPANPSNTESEISRQIEICKPTIAFATSATARKLSSNRVATVLIDSAEFESTSEIGTDSVEVTQSDTAAILFSSGTTGPVKGVTLTYRNLVNVVLGAHTSRPRRESQQRVVLLTVPLFHGYGLSWLLKSLAVGESLVLLTEKFDALRTIRAVERFEITDMVLAPPALVAMTRVEDALMDGRDLRSLSRVVCGGAPIGMETVMRFKSRFPTVILAQGYGLTEAHGGVSLNLEGPSDNKRLESVGRLGSNVEAKIVDPDSGEGLPPRVRGELYIRGPMIMKGYIGDKEATMGTLDSEGWMRTGDLCYIDEEGYLFIVDRLKELIKYNGYQVPPVELEKLLISHPDIIDAAVIPYPDEEAGQVPMAFVVRCDQSNLNKAQVMDYVAKQVAPYKKIRRVSFVASIPKNPAGKILRRELVKLALSHSPSKL